MISLRGILLPTSHLIYDSPTSSEVSGETRGTHVLCTSGSFHFEHSADTSASESVVLISSN